MYMTRQRERTLDLWASFLPLCLFAVPLLTANALYLSLTHQVMVGLLATLGVYIMLRLDLLPFTVPAFMAVGGYAAAMMAKSGTTNLFALAATAMVVPAIVAVPLGSLLLRLKGLYFVLVTFIVNEILQLVLFETPTLTGGSDGIQAVPGATFFGIELGSPRLLLAVTVFAGVLGAWLTFAVTDRFRPEFSSIEENDTLSESLGVIQWKYRTIAFATSAAVSGLAGFALVNNLAAAHPGSFISFTAVNYIAYAFVGGRRTMLGALVGSTGLICLSNAFSTAGQYSAGLFGVLLIVAVSVAPKGIVGIAGTLASANKSRQAPLAKAGGKGALQ